MTRSRNFSDRIASILGKNLAKSVLDFTFILMTEVMSSIKVNIWLIYKLGQKAPNWKYGWILTENRVKYNISLIPHAASPRAMQQRDWEQDHSTVKMALQCISLNYHLVHIYIYMSCWHERGVPSLLNYFSKSLHPCLGIAIAFLQAQILFKEAMSYRCSLCPGMGSTFGNHKVSFPWKAWPN